jgi:voltage-dependent anion channel protein 2
MPFRPSLYKDLNKRSNDLITKDFPSEKKENKVDWKGETTSNVSFETTLTQKGDGSILGTFSPKYRLKEWNTSLTAELKTNKDFKVEATIDDHFTPGLKTTVSGESRGEDLFTTLGLEYKHELATLTASVDYGQSAGSNIKASSVVGAQGFQLGASVDYFVGASNDSTLKEFNATASYSTDEFDIGVFGKILSEKDSNILGSNYFQRVSPDLSVGAEVSFDTQNPETKPKLVAAAQYRIDNDVVVKTKFDTLGKLGLSYSQRFKSSRLVVSGTVDTSNLSNKNSSAVAFNLSLF